MARKKALILTVCAVVTALSGCGRPMLATAPTSRTGVLAARAANDEEAALKALALQAHAAVVAIEAAYKMLKLDTAAGRKLNEKREPVVRDGLKPVVAQLDAVTAELTKKLLASTNAKLAAVARSFEKKAPLAGEALPIDADANALLYRVAQYRIKLGYLIETALRDGALSELPTELPVLPVLPSP